MTDNDTERAALIKHIVNLESDRAATAAGHPGRLLAGAVADRLAVIVQGNTIAVKVRDDGGRFRFLTTAADLAREIVNQNAAAFRSKPTESDDAGAAGENGYSGFTADMLKARAARAAAETKPLTEAERAAARARNPFARGPTFNLTEAGVIRRRDPALAAALQREAGVPD